MRNLNCRSSSSLKLKKQVHLSEVWTGTCLSEVTEKKMSPENSFVIGWPTTNYVVTFRYLIRQQTSLCSLAAAQVSRVSSETMTEATGP